MNNNTYHKLQGGTAGGDGEGVRGGTGSQDDVTTFTFASWLLAPGAGGLPNSGQQGGGGGGVLVSGAGPAASIYQGQGYGGGGSGFSTYVSGLQGVILIEATSHVTSG